jgi:phosphoglycolate phosphatase-like HAD superfamily hydrolase
VSIAPLDPREALRAYRPSRSYLVGIDSDGCAFDTMEVKHKECFIPNIIRYYGLAAVSKFAREAAEFVNLYSKDRGINRFPALIKALDLLRDRPEVRRRGATIPHLPAVREWIASETSHSNITLAKAVEASGDPELLNCLQWSKAVTKAVEDVVHNVPPFPMVRQSLEKLAGQADVLVCSATPHEALAREWAEHDLTPLIGFIAGQEHGSKKEILATAAPADRIPRDHVLMLGDAPGDQKAAEGNGVLFYPIIPGKEEESWQRFHDEALPRFFSGQYAGAYMADRIAEFHESLPENPPWQV